MLATLRIRRFDPSTPHPTGVFQDYALELEPSESVLDGLIKVRETQDDSLSLRCSCRGAICGSCGMRINGHAALACKTKVADASPERGPIRVEPMGNMPVIKDLVTEMQPFWSNIRRIQPWLQPAAAPAEGEYPAAPAAMRHVSGVMTCIMCGVCVSDCPVLEVDPTFVGPAALAKSYRFVADPRDASTTTRLRALNEPGGMWDCTRCMECLEACPKGVAPMERIMSLRSHSIDAHMPSTCGSRHTEVFTHLIADKGRLDEPMLALRTYGVTQWRRILGLIPIVMRAFVRRKLPATGPLHRPIPGIHHLTRLMRHMGRRP